VIANRTTLAWLGRGEKSPQGFTGSIMGMDPGLATGALAVVRFDRMLSWFVATATWDRYPPGTFPHGSRACMNGSTGSG